MELCKTVLQLHPGWTFYKKANISSKSRTCSAGTYKVTCNHCHILGTSNCQVSLLVLESEIMHCECLQVLGYQPEWDVRGFEGHIKQVTFDQTWRRGFLRLFCGPGNVQSNSKREFCRAAGGVYYWSCKDRVVKMPIFFKIKLQLPCRKLKWEHGQ